MRRRTRGHIDPSLVVASVTATSLWIFAGIAGAQEVAADVLTDPSNWSTIGIGGPAVALTWMVIQVRDSFDKRMDENAQTTTRAINDSAKTTHEKLDNIANVIERSIEARP